MDAATLAYRPADTDEPVLDDPSATSCAPPPRFADRVAVLEVGPGSFMAR